MKTRAFGSGRPVSLFSLGTMRALDSASQMAAVINAAAAAGINQLETAPAYGPAERFLGEALRQTTRKASDQWVITSKLLPGLSFEKGQRRLDQIIERLGCSNLDNLAIHGIIREEHLDRALLGEGLHDGVHQALARSRHHWVVLPPLGLTEEPRQHPR